ncbi:hypothetical protein RYX36_007941, partial [Vicia faba]
AQDSRFTITATVTGQAVKWFFQIFVYMQLLLISALVIFITSINFICMNSCFHMAMYHCMLPEKALITAFWLSPLLTLAMGILFMLIGSAWSWIPGLVSLLSAAIQSMYGL